MICCLILLVHLWNVKVIDRHTHTHTLPFKLNWQLQVNPFNQFNRKNGLADQVILQYYSKVTIQSVPNMINHKHTCLKCNLIKFDIQKLFFITMGQYFGCQNCWDYIWRRCVHHFRDTLYCYFATILEDIPVAGLADALTWWMYVDSWITFRW